MQLSIITTKIEFLYDFSLLQLFFRERKQMYFGFYWFLLVVQVASKPGRKFTMQ
jgi:hypothetical protein